MSKSICTRLWEDIDKKLWKNPFYVETYVPFKAKVDFFLFQGARSNAFINTADVRAKGWERVGNFFLQAHLYLFDGKRVVWKDAKKVEHVSIHDANGSIVKTALAVVALIPGDLIGYSFKTLGYHISYDTKLRHDEALKALRSTEVVPVNYMQLGIDALTTHERAPCQEIDYGVLAYAHFRATSPGLIHFPQFQNIKNGKAFLLTPRQAAEVGALKEMSAIFMEAKIPFWLDCGSCLGAYRNRSMVPWDLDIDVAIPQVEFQNAFNSLKKLSNRYLVQDGSPKEHPRSYLTVYVKSTGTQIDINTYILDSNAKSVTYLYPHENAGSAEWFKATDRLHVIPFAYTDIFPLRPTQFAQVDVFVPNKLKDFLLDKYARSAGGRRADETHIAPPYVWNPITDKWDKLQGNTYWNECPEELVLASK